MFEPGGRFSATQPLSLEVEASRVVGAAGEASEASEKGEAGEEDMAIGDTIETEETVEQDIDETVRYINFLKIKWISVNVFLF